MQLDLFLHPQIDRRAAIIAAVATASASQVGARFGVTRNAVLGLVHRTRKLGIEVVTFCPPARSIGSNIVAIRPTLPVPTPRLPVVRTPAPVVCEVPAPVVPIANSTMSGPVSLVDAGPRQCRAIEGESDEGLCCGAEVEGRGSWCARHRAVFRSPAKLRPVTLSARDLT